MKIKRIVSAIGLTALVFIGGLITLIVFPQPLFSHSYEYKNFNVYALYEIDQQELNQYLDQANDLVKASELYDAQYVFDLFIAHESFYNTIDDQVLGKWSIARAIDNNIIIKNKINEQLGIVENGENRFTLDYVIAHEMIHCLQENKYGKLKFNPFNHPPMWKLEGYPEYVARKDWRESETYDLKQEVQDFLNRTEDLEDQHSIVQISANESTPFIYYKSRLMTEYLMNVKKISYDRILADTTSEEAIYLELINWCQNNQ